MVSGFARRPECETHRALNPEWQVTADTFLLRAIEHAARAGVWIHTDDARKRRNYPKPIPLTEAERFAAKPERDRYDLRTFSEIDDLIGWKGSQRGD